MKKIVNPFLVGAGLMASSAAVLAGPTVYGRVDISVGHTNDRTEVEATKAKTINDKQIDLKSNSSRFGIKGDVELEGLAGVKGIYLFEFQVDTTDENAEKNLKARNQYVGLEHEVGTLIVGRMDSPFKSTNAIDLFNDNTLDLDNVIIGGNRLDNAIGYKSPKLMDIAEVFITFQPGEGEQVDGNTTNGVETGIADSISASVSAKMNGFHGAFAVDSQVKNKASALTYGKEDDVYADAMRMTGGYADGPIQAGILFQSAILSTDSKDSSVVNDQFAVALSGAYTLDKLTVKGQLIQAEGENFSDKKIQDELAYAVGVDYAIAKKAKLYGDYTRREVETLNTSEVLVSTRTVDTVTAGIQLNF